MNLHRAYFFKEFSRLGIITLAIVIALASSIATLTTSKTASADSSSEITGAINWAKGQMVNNPTGYDNLCLPFVENAYQDGGGIDINNDHAQNPVQYWGDHKSLQHTNDTNAPAGALVFWNHTPIKGSPITYSNPDGHVALSTGGGWVISSAERNNNDIHPFAISARNAQGYPYLGWMMPPGVSNPSTSPVPSKTWAPTQSFDWPHMTSLEENGLKSNGSGIGGAQYITSPNGEFAFIVSGNGYAALYGGQQSKELWNTNTSGSISAASGGLVLQSDGNLVLYNGNGNVLWSTGTGGNSGDSLVVQNDGNVVLYSWSGKAMWSTGTGSGFEADNLWKSNLTDGQNMTTCEFIQSADGRFTLLEQCNGDLVLYGPGYSTMWHSNTANYGGASLAMQTDGNLVIYAPNNGPAIWSTGTGGNSGDSLVVQNDGNVVLYSWSGKSMWSTGT